MDVVVTSASLPCSPVSVPKKAPFSIAEAPKMISVDVILGALNSRRSMIESASVPASKSAVRLVDPIKSWMTRPLVSFRHQLVYPPPDVAGPVVGSVVSPMRSRNAARVPRSSPEWLRLSLYRNRNRNRMMFHEKMHSWQRGQCCYAHSIRQGRRCCCGSQRMS